MPRSKQHRAEIDFRLPRCLSLLLPPAMAHRLTYAQRAARHPNPAAKALLETIERKKTNLCVSVDVTKRDDFLSVIDVVGPYVCLVKVRYPFCKTSNKC